MAHKVILPPKKNYIPQFLKQRDINSYYMLTLSKCRCFVRTLKDHFRALTEKKHKHQSIQHIKLRLYDEVVPNVQILLL